MRNDLIIIGSVAFLLILFTYVSVLDSPAGYVIVEGGQINAIGRRPIINPRIGIVYGNIVWEIKDGDTVISTDAPDEEIDVYFVPVDRVVDWEKEIECENSIRGTVNKIDADAEEKMCKKSKYKSPTTYICEAEAVDQEKIIIYRITTDMKEGNAGCFAGKLFGGEYDVYA